MKTAIVHDWLTGMRGGEKCLEVFCDLFPDADLFTLLHLPGSVSPCIEKMPIRTSFLQRLPRVETHYRHYLPFMPFAVRSLDLREYDFVLSSSHCVAKGVRVSRKAVHVCYCYTPMRYIWDQYEQYFGGCITPASLIMKGLRPFMQWWDVRSNRGVDQFIAISRFVQQRIRKYYNRESTVIYPPVNTEFYRPTGERPENYFLMVSALAPYKRVDLAVEAFNRIGYPLKIIGDGQDARQLMRSAGPHIELLGRLSDPDVRYHYARCRALIFPGEEDFGITPLEAQSMGRPVIALGRGGALETVIPDELSWKASTGISRAKTKSPTGVFFYEKTPDALVRALRHFESVEKRFEPGSIRQHALQFDKGTFSYRMKMFLEAYLKKRAC